MGFESFYNYYKNIFPRSKCLRMWHEYKLNAMLREAAERECPADLYGTPCDRECSICPYGKESRKGTTHSSGSFVQEVKA